jgi:hypothetical protein
MKSLCLLLLLALSTPGCSHFSKANRTERAYYRQLKQVKAEREKHRKQVIQHQRAAMPALRNEPPPSPPEQPVQPAPDNQ